MAGIISSTCNNLGIFYHYDFVGNVTEGTDSLQTLLSEQTYSPWGEGEFTKTSLSLRFRLNTKEYDEYIDLCYYGYRFYCGDISKWINRDPAGEENEKNLYRVVCNTPLRFIDPYGDSLWDSLWNSIADMGKSVKDCYDKMRRAKDMADSWWDMDKGKYTCCVDGKDVDMEQFPGVTTGKPGSTYGVLHCALGVAAKYYGVDDTCLAISNGAWETYEMLNPRYWEWKPTWWPWPDNGKGLQGWVDDTISDMEEVFEGYYSDKSKMKDCVPGQCRKQN